MKLTKDELLFLLAAFLFGISVMLLVFKYFNIPQKITITTPNTPAKYWQIESIDTMKYSRDMARQGLNNTFYANEINKQVGEIAATGANYIAIDTPYDPEFLPVLKLWVQAARENNLHIWFRGNWSGWEGWFNYPPIDETTHIAETKQFILNNKNLFQDGDIFTPCPECENGMKLNTGYPQSVQDYKNFLFTEEKSDKNAFNSINKNVATNFFSMNADVARAVMDKKTTQELGGVVVIDHYVKTPQELNSDISSIAALSGGKIMLGEFGAPIPDLQGTMTDQQQQEWLETTLKLLSTNTNLIGVNYWVNEGGSTALWAVNDSPKPAVSVITKYYQATR